MKPGRENNRHDHGKNPDPERFRFANPTVWGRETEPILARPYRTGALYPTSCRAAAEIITTPPVTTATRPLRSILFMLAAPERQSM